MLPLFFAVVPVVKKHPNENEKSSGCLFIFIGMIFRMRFPKIF